MSGQLFENLKALQLVKLEGNACIDLNFENQTELLSMPQIITDKCRVIEVPKLSCEERLTMIETLVNMNSNSKANSRVAT